MARKQNVDLKVKDLTELVAEAMRRFFADRSVHMGDPDFVHVPVTGLLNPGYVQRLRQFRRHAHPIAGFFERLLRPTGAVVAEEASRKRGNCAPLMSSVLPISSSRHR